MPSPSREEAQAGKDATRARHGGSERASGRDDRQFARLDRNGDGFIDAKEFETWVAERAVRAAQRFIERFDADGDGKVSKDEFKRFAKDRLSGRSGDGRRPDHGGGVGAGEAGAWYPEVGFVESHEQVAFEE